MRRIQEKLAMLANTPVPVLILGESGTGKDVLARLLHRSSSAAAGTFVKLSCPAIPASLLETELFGYEKGAFTGAYGTKRGRVEMAHKGTLFLDEIGDLDGGLQSKLLQLLQDGTYCRVGGHEERRVSIRIISATNRDLQEQVQTGHFRQDLFYRINALTIELPPLRQRIVDLPELIDYFLAIYAAKFARILNPLSSETVTLLKHYHWPGNIRELENVIRRYAIFGTEESITSELMNAEDAPTINTEVTIDPDVSLKEITQRVLVELEREIILKVLKANDWNRKRTAESLKISYRSLLYKMRDAGFPLIRVRTADQADRPPLQMGSGTAD
jgi:two-component system response regulator AtoC